MAQVAAVLTVMVVAVTMADQTGAVAMVRGGQ